MQLFIVLLAFLCLISSSTTQACINAHASPASLSTIKLSQHETQPPQAVDSCAVPQTPADIQDKDNSQGPSGDIDDSTIDVHPFKFTLHNFPSTDLLHTARIGVLDALELAHAALIGLENLTTSYHRYFDLNDIDLVKEVFESVATGPTHSTSASTHIIDVWYDDAFDTFNGCQEGLNVYHISEREGDQRSNIILCPFLLFRHASFLDSITEDEIPDHSNEVLETLGFIILHELIHLTSHSGGFALSGQDTQSKMIANPANQRDKGTNYSAYLSMKVNKDEKAGSRNATNYGFYAAESYFLQIHHLASFHDPQPSGLMENLYHGSTREKGQHDHQDNGSHLLTRRRVPITNNNDKNYIEIVARDVLPPTRMPWKGWPENIFFVNFPRVAEPNQYRLIAPIAHGLVDSWRLADRAYSILTKEPPSTSFNRYFRSDDACAVRSIFKKIVDDARPQPPGSVNPRRWSIHWGDANLKHVTDQSCRRTGTEAYFDYFEPDNTNLPVISICAAGFTWNSVPLDDLTCAKVGNRADRNAMSCWGLTMLHETLHDRSLAFPFIGERLVDVSFEYLGFNIQAYGPYLSYVANIERALGHRNNDNYVFFALEEWFRDKCGWEYTNPVLDQNAWFEISWYHQNPPNKRDLRSDKLLGHSTSQPSKHNTLFLGEKDDTTHANIVARAGLPPMKLPDGWPQNFVFINFPDEPVLYDAAAGLIEMWTEVEKVSSSLTAEDLPDAYLRYFQPQQLCKVQAVLKAVLDSAAWVPTANHRTYSIYWGDESASQQRCNEGLVAFFVQLDLQTRDKPAIFLCPQKIEPSFRGYPGFTLSVINCESLMNRNQRYQSSFENFFSWIYIFLHEILHDDALTVPVIGERIIDQDINLSKEDQPQRCYGPWLSWQLNSRKPTLSYLNSDSYVGFVLQQYFTKKCDKKFKEPAVDLATNQQHWVFDEILALRSPDRISSMIAAPLQLLSNREMELQHGSSLSSKSQSLAVKDQTVTANLAVRAGVFPPGYPPVKGWPQQVMFTNFPDDKPEYFEWAYLGVINAIQLAYNAHDALSQRGPSRSFFRYFQAGQECRVRSHFAKAIHDFAASVGPFGPAHMVDRSWWTIEYNHAECATHPKWLAAFIYNQPTALITICPSLFGPLDFPYLRKLKDISCDDITDRALLSTMVNTGAILLHEILHNSAMTMSLDGLKIADLNINPKGVELPAYGPWRSFYLNSNSMDAIRNDDNWV